MKRPSSTIPAVSESQYLEETWVCADCHGKTSGAECQFCGMPRRDARIIVPDGECGEDLMDRITTPNRCGDCIHFDLRGGQERLHDPKDMFFAKLIHEMELKSVATNMSWKEVGICKQWTGRGSDLMITCSSSPARCARKHIDSSTPYKLKDRNVPCPAFKPDLSSDGKRVKSYRMVPGGRTHGTD